MCGQLAGVRSGTSMQWWSSLPKARRPPLPIPCADKLPTWPPGPQAREAAAGPWHVPTGGAGRNGCACLVGQGPEEGEGRVAGCAGGHPRGQPGGRAGRAGPTAALELSPSRLPPAMPGPLVPPVPTPRPTHPCVWDPARPMLVTSLRCPAPGSSASMTDPVGEGGEPWEMHTGPGSEALL